MRRSKEQKQLTDQQLELLRPAWLDEWGSESHVPDLLIGLWRAYGVTAAAMADAIAEAACKEVVQDARYPVEVVTPDPIDPVWNGEYPLSHLQLVGSSLRHDEMQQDRPTVVCLCGSTRFMEAFQEANLNETLAGRIVLTIGCDTKNDAMLHLGPVVKEGLDRLHKAKIRMADEILILNVGGYIGESTASEIAYARALCKRVRWLEIPESIAGVDHDAAVARGCYVVAPYPSEAALEPIPYTVDLHRPGYPVRFLIARRGGVDVIDFVGEKGMFSDPGEASQEFQAYWRTCMDRFGPAKAEYFDRCCFDALVAEEGA